MPTAAPRRFARRRPILSFVLVAFGWSWGVDALVIVLLEYPNELAGLPRTWGPLVGALAVTWAGKGSLREWFDRVTTWRLRPRWYLLALLVPLAFNELHTVVQVASGASASFPSHPIHLLAANFLGVLLLAGGLEEFGWRGFVQPRMQERTSALVAGVLVGLLWACWHLPLFVAGVPGYEVAALPRYVAWVVAVSVALGASVNATGGSVVPAMVAHAAINQPRLFATTGGEASMPAALVDAMYPLAWWGVVAALAVAYGVASMAPRRAVEPLS